MKFNKTGQLLLVSAASLAAASLITACSQFTATLTADFVYVTSARAAASNDYGVVNVFEINSESGAMRQIPSSPFPSGGRNPVASATSTDNANLYVVNRDDNTIVQFAIGTDGKLYPQSTVNTPGIFPLGIAVTGSYLYVADTYQPLPTCSTASPCAGSVAVFPLSKSGAFGSAVANAAISANYWPLTLPGSSTDVVTPAAITVTGSGSLVYVAAYDQTANSGYVFGFTANADGTLTAVNGGVPVPAGTQPSAITADPTGSYLYVTDEQRGDVLGYSINAGLLTPISGSPFPAGNMPAGIVMDKTGKYLFVANSQDANLTVYAASGGALSRLGTYATGIQPVAVGIDPALNQYVFTANFLGSNVSGFQLNAADGTLLNSQNSPYRGNQELTSVAAIPHGKYAK
ncbi:MAG TPA: beta-propeller fold lactonase family protein [Terracidiphilus sp.]|nr:beta-propeller fold lactonase family protein [Terracidiphilus sp.]